MNERLQALENVLEGHAIVMKLFFVGLRSIFELYKGVCSHFGVF